MALLLLFCGALMCPLSRALLQQDIADDSRIRELFDIQVKLQSLGVAEDLAVPKLVVCGDQSAGKSSILQRITGIELPRAAGTCTRAPMEVNLRRAPPDQPWQCQVSLRIGEGRQVPFGGVITDKTQVQEYLRRAQFAVLHPDDDPMAFLGDEPLPNPESLDIKFTDDTVVVDIRDPHANDLTLVDLPGLVHSMENEDEQHYADQITDLTRKYISRPEVVIVAAFSAKTEMESQAIYALAREVDPKGERTIGVLTKVDTIETGTHEKWFNYLRGGGYKLKLGYFMVKNPAQADIAEGPISPEVATQREKDFFASSAPFAQRVTLLRDHMGLDKLVVQLRSELIRRMMVCVPGMLQTARIKLKDAENELRALPNALAISELPDQLDRLMRDMGSKLSLLESILETPGQHDKLTEPLAMLLIDNPYKVLMNLHPVYWLGQHEAENGRVHQYWFRNGYGTTVGPQPNQGAKDVRQLQELIDRHYGMPVLTGLPYGALKAVMDEWTEEWLDVLTEVSHNVCNLLEDHVLSVADAQFGSFPRLASLVRQNIMDALSRLKAHLTSEVHRAINKRTKTFVGKRAKFTDRVTSKVQEMQSQKPKGVDLSTDVINLLARAHLLHEAKADIVSENLPMAIERFLFQPIAQDLSSGLARELATFKQSADNETSDQARVSVTKWYDNPAILDLVLQDPEVSDTMEKRTQLETRVRTFQEVVKVLKSMRH